MRAMPSRECLIGISVLTVAAKSFPVAQNLGGSKASVSCLRVSATHTPRMVLTKVREEFARISSHYQLNDNEEDREVGLVGKGAIRI